MAHSRVTTALPDVVLQDLSDDDSEHSSASESAVESSSDEEEGLSPEQTLQALREDWRTAAIVHFCRAFAEPLKIARGFPTDQVGLDRLVEQDSLQARQGYLHTTSWPGMDDRLAILLTKHI